MFDHNTLGLLLKFIPRQKFADLVKLHKSDRYKKTFKSWDHFVVLLIAQLIGAKSLRDLETVVNLYPRAYYHLNLGFTHLSRSTLSDANQRLNPSVFRDLVNVMIDQSTKGQHKKEMQGFLSILDSSLIRVKGRGSQWAESTRTRNANQGLKLHLELNATEHLIEYVHISLANVNDITVAQDIPLKSQRLYVFDKGYCDYNFWQSIASQNAQFVTRLKSNAAYSVTEHFQVKAEDEGFILKDQMIVLTNKQPRGGKKNALAGIPLRLIKIKHPHDPKKEFMLVSNAIDAQASEIAGWYKERWAIELLFKWLKQNLKLTSFLSENHNGIMLQIYVAIIAFLLLQAYKTCQKQFHRLKDILVLVKTQLFQRPTLIDKVHWQRLKKLRGSHSSFLWEGDL